MRRRVQNLKPYALTSDFTAQNADDPDQITLTAADLAALLADTRESTAALVRDETLSAEAKRLEAVSTELRAALGAIADLAAHIEKAAIDEHDRNMALGNIRRIAATLIDGQGELFTKNTLRSQVGNHSK
ncbi:MAG: hypothetical protein L3J02_06545 [Henriciella sp.]|nr:hypothetical protein [Henriciella sp.]